MDHRIERSAEHPDIVTVNMGPSHPATHGVLRLVLKLEGERVRECVPHLGYLHRGMEKIAEERTYLQFIPYTDRMDYLSPLASNVGIALAIEKLLDLDVPERCSAVRVICCELARLGSHLLWLGVHALDLGAATVFFHTFKDREWHYDLVEDLTGARLTTSFTRVGGMLHDVDKKWLVRLREFTDAMPGRIDEFESLLTTNAIWLQRTQGVGAINRADAIAFGMTGPSLRAAGEPYDLRKQRPYCGYENYEFEVPTGTHGDIYDRYLVRLEEMRQSVRILNQVLDNLPEGPVNIDDPKIFLPAKKDVLTSMEELIHQFMIVTEGFECPAGEIYHATEVPKGELGFYIVSTGGRSPYRLRIRSPSFNNLATLPHLVEGGLVADVVANIASLDPVMGEVDRSMFSAEFERRVDALVARYPEPKAAMLMVLWEVQKEKGWIDSQSEAWVAERLGTSPAQVHGVVSFYTMYKQRPMGRHHIQVCTTVSCMLRGSDELMDHLKTRLGIDEGEVTQDGKFSLVRVECLGSCGTAPMFQLNDDYHEDLTIESVDRLLDGLD